MNEFSWGDFLNGCAMLFVLLIGLIWLLGLVGDRVDRRNKDMRRRDTEAKDVK